MTRSGSYRELTAPAILIDYCRRWVVGMGHGTLTRQALMTPDKTLSLPTETFQLLVLCASAGLESARDEVQGGREVPFDLQDGERAMCKLNHVDQEGTPVSFSVSPIEAEILEMCFSIGSELHSSLNFIPAMSDEQWHEIINALGSARAH